MMLLKATEILNQNIHSIWENIFFYLFIVIILFFLISIFFHIKIFRKKNNEIKLLQQQNITRIDNIRKENSSVLDNLRVEMLKHENERIRQWMESEKETLHVLNGVSTLLELSDKVDKVEFKNIREALNVIEKLIKDLK
jgi:hypothetical protein